MAAPVRFFTSRLFLIASFLILAFFVIVTDPDFFNPQDMIPTLAKPAHHEMLFVGLIVLAGAAVTLPDQTHRLLLLLVGLSLTLLSIATFIIPP